MAGIFLNPSLTTRFGQSFSVSSNGFVQGDAQDDPVTKYRLLSGVLSASETSPMWPGIPVQELIGPSDNVLGNTLTRATATANVAGICVSNGAFHGLTTPQSSGPQYAAGMGVNYYRAGSGARIPLPIDPSLVALIGGATTQFVSWDYVNNVLQPYDASTSSVAITSMTGAFSGGVWTIAVVMSAATVVGAVGDFLTISGATNSGTGGNALVNGSFRVSAFTDNQHFSFQITAVAGAVGTIAGSPILNFGVGAFPVKIVSAPTPNGRVLQYDAATGFLNYVPGYIALCQI